MYEQTGLAYNRFRYYDKESGNYISQDLIGLDGNNPTIYGYVHDTNGWVDVFGLDVYDLIAAEDGWYPVYEYGVKDPVAYTRLKQGDVYKVGESQNPTRRYSKTRLDEARINRSPATSVAVDSNGRVRRGATGNTIPARLQRKVDPTTVGNAKSTDRAIETTKIKAHEATHGDLPAGNKTHH